MAMTEGALAPLLLPLRETACRSRSTWTQFCALCLAEDRAPYFRRSMATRLADFLLQAWLRPAGPMSRLPRRDCSLRSDGLDPALCLRALRFRPARRREHIGRGGGASAGTVDRRYLQGGNRQGIADDPRMGRAPAARSRRCRPRLRPAARQPAGVGAHPLLRAARAEGRRWARRRCARPGVVDELAAGGRDGLIARFVDVVDAASGIAAVCAALPQASTSRLCWRPMLAPLATGRAQSVGAATPARVRVWRPNRRRRRRVAIERGRRIRAHKTPHARYRPRPVASRRPSSATRFCAARGVMSSSLAIMPAETSGREITYSISSGSREVERRPSSFRKRSVRARSQRSCCFRPSSAAAAIASSSATRRVVASRLRRRSRGTAFAPSARHGRCARVLPRSAQERGGEQAAEAGRAPQRLDRAPGLVGKRGGERRRQVARLIDDRAPLRRGARPRPSRGRRRADRARHGRRRGPPFAGEGSVGLDDGRVDRGEQFRELVVLGDRRIERLVFVCDRLVVFDLGLGCVRPPCPAPQRIETGGDSAQPGAAPAMRRRARNTVRARVSSWVGVRMSMPASCSTRSSRWTSSPSSHSAAAASTKWVLAIQPSRMGLVRSRSSSRANASSARASGRARSGQGSGSRSSALK